MNTITAKGSAATITLSFRRTLAVVVAWLLTSTGRGAEARYDTSGWVYGLPVSDTFEYVADPEEMWLVKDVSDPGHPRIVGGYKTLASVYHVSVAGSHAYVKDHNEEGKWGLRIIDITDPVTPQPSGFQDLGRVISDSATIGDYAYLVDDLHDPEDGLVLSLQVFDIQDPTSPQLVGVSETFGMPKACRVAVSGNFSYVALLDGNGFGPGGLVIVDISDPLNPQIVGSLQAGNRPWTGYPDLAISGHHAFLVGEEWFNNLGEESRRAKGLFVIDIRDPANPLRIGEYQVAELGFSDWMHMTVSVSGRYAYVCGMFGMVVIDIKDPTNPQRVADQTGFVATGVAASEDKVFVATDSGDLLIFDAIRPPVELTLSSAGSHGPLALSVSGPSGAVVKVQRSADLHDWQDWQTVTLGGTPTEVSDSPVGTGLLQFYRTVEQ